MSTAHEFTGKTGGKWSKVIVKMLHEANKHAGAFQAQLLELIAHRTGNSLRGNRELQDAYRECGMRRYSGRRMLRV